jgi:hypothetical protein
MRWQDIWFANLTAPDLIPVLDFSTARGVRTSLYNLCEDPMEMHNLLVGAGPDSQARRDAARLFHEFIGELRDAVSAVEGGGRGESSWLLLRPYRLEHKSFPSLCYSAAR